MKSSFKTEEGEKQGAFSFVCFKEAMDAMKALEAMNGAEVEGAVLFVTKAQRKKEREAEKLRRKQDRKRASQNCTVYIKNFKPESVSEENVRAVFSEVEGLKSVFIPTYKQMNSQGELVTMRKPFGFITYENPSQVEEVGILYIYIYIYIGSDQVQQQELIGRRASTAVCSQIGAT